MLTKHNKRRFRNFAPLVAFFFLFSLRAVPQSLEQIEQLISLQEMNMDQNQNEDSSEAINENIQPQRVDEQSDEESIYEEKEFGFSGRNDFLVLPKAKPTSKALKHFGYEYFSSQPQQYSSITDIAIPPDYILGPGDQLKIILFGNNNKKYTLTVTRDGDIFLPDVGPISVAGLTFSDVKETIQQIVENQLIGTQFSLTLGNLRSISIFVLGEARKPGRYTVSALSTLTNAIFLSGGLNTNGSLRNIQLKRKGQTVTEFDFYKLLLDGDTTGDSRLMNGDVVFIPPSGKKVAILGEINRPAIYELSDKENAENLISYAGKLKPKANSSSLELQRLDYSGDGYNLIELDIDRDPLSNLKLNDGDVIIVGSVSDKINNAVLLSGHAPRTGFFPWKEGMDLKEILISEGELLPDTDLNYVLIKRLKSDMSSHEVFQTNIDTIFNEGFALEQRDEIFLFPSILYTKLIKVSQPDEEEKKYGLINVKRSLEAKELIQKRDNQNTQMVRNNNLRPEADLSEEEMNFNYQVHDYCILDENITSILLDEIEYESEAEQLENQLDKLFKGRDKNNSYELTKFCRQQLIKPIIDALEQSANQIQDEMIVEVYGGVYFPGRYPLAINATVIDIINASGGLRSNTFLDSIEISSRSTLGKENISQNKSLSFNQALQTPLKPKDVITVKKISDAIETVTLTGEIYFPGTYPIAKNESLFELIERAGGLTENANTGNTLFTRKEIAQIQLKRFKQAQDELKRQILLSSNSNAADDEYLARLSSLSESDVDLEGLGRLVFDYDAIKSGVAEDIVLIDGDKIEIQKDKQTVSILGEVYAPNTVFFESELNLDDYIKLSGGVTKYGSFDDAYIIRSNGTVYPIKGSNNNSGGFFRGSRGFVQPGDTIVIPVEIVVDENIKRISELSAIIYQLGFAAAAINNIR